jgi:5-formyltetrahydrofolate cyclo-ligase
MDALAAKQACRTQAKTRIRDLSPSERQHQGQAVRARVQASSEWQCARRVLLFVSRPDEIDLGLLLREALSQGKVLGLPAFDGQSGTYGVREVVDLDEDLVPGQFHIPEPRSQCRNLDVTKLDYALVPGLAFDVRGGRLGRGKGFYDRLLIRVRGWRCGVGFNEQIFPAVPMEEHDLPMHRILTAAQSYDCESPN